MTFRRGIVAAVLAAFLAGLVLVVLPMVASTLIVRDRISHELTSLTGYKVAVRRGPSISFWPTVTASLEGVALSGWDAGSSTPVLEAERVEIEMSPWSALAGNIAFSHIRLIRPTLRLSPRGRLLYASWEDGGGRIGHAIASARAAVASNPSAPATGELPDDPLGEFEFVDGRAVVFDGENETEIATSMAGRIEWLALDRPAIMSLRAVWRGEPVRLDATVVNPLLLLGGGGSDLAVSLKASPVDAGFEGSASLSGDTFVNGALRFSSPSMKRFMEWSRGPSMSGLPPGPVTLASQVSGTFDRLRLADAELVVDEWRGVGALDVLMTSGTPTVTGTMAFGQLDLGVFLSAFTPLRAPDGPRKTEIEAATAPSVNLDVRISATQASWGALTFTDLAATAQVKDGLAALDLTDASAFGGTLQASLRINSSVEARSTEIRMLAENVDAAAFARDAGLESLAPEGRGMVSVILKGHGNDWSTVLSTASGSLSARLGPGRLAGFDLDAFVERIGQSEFFGLREVANGSFAVEGAELKAALVSGATRIDRAVATLPEREIVLDGIVSSFGRGMALSGAILPRTRGEDGEEPEPLARFFVGGSLDAPIISPLTIFWGGQ
ncbi:MAG: AsmA family protein [Rhizobiaceae bacterium]|nr:AsmA family protein [Rhizobiaceae bacterium]